MLKHDFGAVEELHVTCKRCGLQVTIAAFMMGLVNGACTPIETLPTTKCECGAHKTSGVGPGPGHSRWCPWSAP